MTQGNVAVDLYNVNKIYNIGKVSIHALRDVTLKVLEGEFIVVLGPSGSGKSTLLNIIGGIDRPTSGKVIVNGINLQNLSDDELTEFRRKFIGFVFQFFNLIPTLTARENIMLTLELAGVKKHELKKRADELLELVGLKDRADHFPAELSGGQQQRVAIARAVAANPKLLLCDEPTGELDMESGKRVLSIIKKVNLEKGTTVIMVTHNTAISKIASRVIRLRDGQVVETKIIESPIDVSALSW
ncbi:MAG: ABC transporter ATP-binding protein [Candidatus Odinarchaeota archaeon]|nr:ABC transporter ATP-binding protein [Candidatus Odinarchaeota archaeon]